ncbi:BQ5605_C006g04219 [Microbotryum silenes-dioicae]|uniref:BQ5605_C006g04219 protein n=1 Tax=Microbotryum silenes-dioicae TaxID=796604 RepID=A0A2X0M6C6_9BASI|nr:BQ5605_C006g04219 [Microbotryum silenes-dioicae]
MNMTIAELLAFDVAPADASLHIELSKDEHTQYSTLSSTRCPPGHKLETSASSCRCSRYQFLAQLANLIAHQAAHKCSHLKLFYSREADGIEQPNSRRGRRSRGLVQSMGPYRCEDMAGTTRSFRWTGGDQMDRALTTHEDPEESNGALAQRYPHFGALDGGAVTTTTTSKIGSLICFGLKCGMHSLSCDQTVYGEEALSIGIGTLFNQDTLASLVLLSNVVVQELRLLKKTCYSTHLIDGTMPFRMIDGRQVIESLGPSTTTYRSTTDLTSCYPDERLISTSAHAEQRFAALRSVQCTACEMPPAEPLQAAQMPSRKQGAQLQQKGSLKTKQRASQQSKEGLFEAWSHAQHQPKRRAPQATSDRPPRARKRSERVFEDF